MTVPAGDAREVLVDALGVESDALENFVVRGEALADSQVTRFDVTNEMSVGVVQDVRKSVEALTAKQFLAYDPSYQTSTSQVLVEDLDQIPELAVLDTSVRLGDVSEDEGGDSVVAMAHALGVKDTRIVAYRFKGPGIATRRAKGITLIPRDGIYRPVEGDILFYEPRFDAFTCGGFAYFTTVTLIQTKLHADAKARELAQRTLVAVTAKVEIDGFDGLETAVMNDPTLRAKMAYVARLIESDPAYADHLTTQRLVEFVETYPDYNIPVSTVNGAKALLFDPSPQHRHQIPRLLADDYLHSYLTDRNYEAGSKQRATG
ncbi:hypothetical protein [Nocardioides sp. KR10-350]|uniref:hypothetical protein n=1 Tax=Nocardioides cheoyonin TaxID=3156615 RepID=UPI0032B35959